MSWTNLDVELKQTVIGLLDYESRCHLRSCSKTDKATVDSTKITAKTMKIKESSSAMAPRKTIIRIDIDSFTIWFIGRENVTRINRGWNGEVIEELSEMKQVNRYELVTQFFYRIIRNRFVKAETLEIENLKFPPPESWNLICDNLKTEEIDDENTDSWHRALLKYSQKFKKLELYCWGSDPEVMRLISNSVASDCFIVEHDTEMNDEELEKITATHLKVTSDRLTAMGAKKRLKYYLKNGKQEDQVELFFMQPENFNAIEQVFPKELILEKLEIEGAQEGDFRGKIIGGFDNIHGITAHRNVICSKWGIQLARIFCTVPKMEDAKYKLYPFDFK